MRFWDEVKLNHEFEQRRKRMIWGLEVHEASRRGYLTTTAYRREGGVWYEWGLTTRAEPAPLVTPMDYVRASNGWPKPRPLKRAVDFFK